MKNILIVFLSFIVAPGLAQNSSLTPDTTLVIPKLNFDSKGDLIIKASFASSATDFDFLIGTWKLKNRRLKSRLTNCTEWMAFESKVEMYQILGGKGNIDRYTDSATSKRYEGIALRLFDSKTRLWSIYWADNNSGSFDPPLVGSFENNVGHFFGKDTFKEKNIIVVFRWDIRNPKLPIWSQAFSIDNGKSWEWNSINVSEKIY